jgi:hypothetical protein
MQRAQPDDRARNAGLRPDPLTRKPRKANTIAGLSAHQRDVAPQARYRAARATDAPVTRTPRPADHRGRARSWHDAVAEMTHLQTQHAAWLEALPPKLQDGLLADALQLICDLDLAELQAIDPPRWFGRD